MSNFDEMNKVLNEQKEFFIKNGSPSTDLRIDRLERLKMWKYKTVFFVNQEIVDH